VVILFVVVIRLAVFFDVHEGIRSNLRFVDS